ncbi:MAG: hypothetical protein L3K14_01180 [Thermoplasmata archaeon]|nr:hypothetical protein [Thermoplasmata archaeon]
MKKFIPVGSVLGGFLSGGFAGFAAVNVWPGASSWPFTVKMELFLGIAIPVGVAEFFINRCIIPLLARASLLRVRRVAIFDGKLYLDQFSGASTERPLKQVSVSKEAIAGGWY